MEKLVDSGLLAGVIDITTTEICDMMVGGIFPATEDRFGAMIRTSMPYVGSCGALDMVNFGAPDTVPERFQGRVFYEHNPQVTLMRTTAEENAEMGRWIGERLNQMDRTRPLLPPRRRRLRARCSRPSLSQSGRGQARCSPRSNRPCGRHRRDNSSACPHHINDPAFATAVVDAFRSLHGQPGRQRMTRH